MSGSDTLELIEENLPEGFRDDLRESDLGTQVGGSYGEQAGRQLGQQIGTTVERRFRSRLDAGTTVWRALVAAFEALPAAILHALRENASPRRAVSNLKSQLETEAKSLVSNAEAEASGAATGAADASTERADSVPGLPDNVSKLREETIRDLLGVMSYRELQSTAKELGVTANRSREAIVEDVVEQVSGGDDAEHKAAEGDAES
ncbi:hypothetical protein [Halohasta salina]|uniref:hypothetical protein n=1 Tax=Halohasta salina TaxID=2961621 RepID=UPI0020A365CF|nr:hypothetical protein [Halohasta salina]